jgi:hypothetical protein
MRIDQAREKNIAGEIKYRRRRIGAFTDGRYAPIFDQHISIFPGGGAKSYASMSELQRAALVQSCHRQRLLSLLQL